MENGSIKIARSLGVRAAGGETKMVTVIKNWKMVESSVEKGPNVPENARKMVRPQYRLTLRCLRSALTHEPESSWEHWGSMSMSAFYKVALKFWYSIFLGSPN